MPYLILQLIKFLDHLTINRIETMVHPKSIITLTYRDSKPFKLYKAQHVGRSYNALLAHFYFQFR